MISHALPLALLLIAQSDARNGETPMIGGHPYLKLETREATRNRMLDLLVPSKGRWSSWKILSPFPYAGHGKDDLKTHLPPEDELPRMRANGPGPDLDRVYEGKNGVKARWIDVGGDPGTKVVLTIHDDDDLNNDAVCYAYATVECDEDMSPVIPLGSDDGIRIWVNGRLVHSVDVPRGLDPTQDKVRFPFVKGTNHVLMKISQGGGGWEFQVNPRARLDEALDALLYYYLDRDFPLNREREHYQVITYPVPDEHLVLEIGGIAFLRDGRPVVCTRRGDVFIVENAYQVPPFDVSYTRFASGLHEPLGLGVRPGETETAVYAVQRGELTRLVDEDGDDRADLYQTWSDAWDISGNYHEFAFGPEFDEEGNAYVTLNVGFCGSLGKASVPTRGSCVRIAPDGSMTFVCDGLRSPNGIGTFDGERFYVDNQGDYVATNKLAHLKPGSWHGHPASLRWREELQSVDERPPRQPPAVWFPYGRMGQSAADIETAHTGGRFGPFDGQLFVGDQLACTIMRVTLEKVEGHYQGACYPFLEGLACGVNRLRFAPDGSLIVGETDRGWGSLGRKRQGLERVIYTGKTPFEILEMSVRPDGFALTFTHDVDPRTAGDPASYSLSSFTYRYHSAYGAPEEDREDHEIVACAVEGPRQVRLSVKPMRRGYVHELHAAGVRNLAGDPLLHDQAWYTVTNLPGQPPFDREAPRDLPRVLFLTHSAGFVHDVVKRPRPHILSWAEEQLVEAARGRFQVEPTQDCSRIDAENLARYDAVVFFTTGELPIFDDDREALFSWVRDGGAFIGIHSATDTWYEQPVYQEMIGGVFDGHPWNQEVVIVVEDPGHPSAKGLPPEFALADEIYQFRDFRRYPLSVVLGLDPESVEIEKGRRDDRDYALSWWKNYGRGRVFYTALGHREEVWENEDFRSHLLNAIDWAIRGDDPVVPPPPGALVLFDGGGTSELRHEDGSDVTWNAVDEALEVRPGAGDVFTRREFSDFLLHVEFMTPDSPKSARGQARGNSGVYLLGRYEVQVLDSFGVESGARDCGAIYGKKAPDTNACREPGRWQTYDIRFQAPRFDREGAKVANARVSVWQNGLMIHDDVEIDTPTGAAAFAEERETGPIQFQDHADRVRYRNLWILPSASDG